MKQWIFLLFILPAFVANSQQWQQELTKEGSLSAGIQLQLVVAIGSHKTSAGVRLNAYLAVDHVQLNMGTTYRFHAADLGGRTHFGEWRHDLGLVLMAGRKNNPVNFQWDGSLHQSRHPFSLGYTYLWYADKAATSQRSGAWSLGLRRWDILFENDVFAGQGKDRFRTGSLQVTYRTVTQKIGIGLQLWTGESGGSVWTRVASRKDPNGYRDLSSLPYGKTSHGILYLTGQQVFGNGQVAGIQLGYDSEQVRHIFQNRITHDLIWLPKGVQRNTPHYPRLGKNGEMVFTRKEQRPVKMYFQANLNDGTLY